MFKQMSPAKKGALTREEGEYPIKSRDGAIGQKKKRLEGMNEYFIRATD